MLEALPQQAGKRPLTLQVQNPFLRPLLTDLLSAWEFNLQPAATTDSLLLSDLDSDDGGLTLSTAVTCLGSFPFPLDLPRLYRHLSEQQQPDSDASHSLRIRITLPLQLEVRGRGYATHTVQLCERGVRFHCPLELVPGEKLEVELPLTGRVYRLQGEVSYSLAAEQQESNGQYDTGIIFKPLAAATRQFLGAWVLGSYLLQLRQNGARLTREVLNCLELPETCRMMLS